MASLDIACPQGLTATYSLRKSARILGISEPRLRRMIEAGQIRTVVLGSWPVVPVGELQRVLQGL